VAVTLDTWSFSVTVVDDVGGRQHRRHRRRTTRPPSSAVGIRRPMTDSTETIPDWRETGNETKTTSDVVERRKTTDS
jgi:hypothetical protein